MKQTYFNLSKVFATEAETEYAICAKKENFAHTGMLVNSSIKHHTYNIGEDKIKCCYCDY